MYGIVMSYIWRITGGQHLGKSHKRVQETAFCTYWRIKKKSDTDVTIGEISYFSNFPQSTTQYYIKIMCTCNKFFIHLFI